MARILHACQRTDELATLQKISNIQFQSEALIYLKMESLSILTFCSTHWICVHIENDQPQFIRINDYAIRDFRMNPPAQMHLLKPIEHSS